MSQHRIESQSKNEAVVIVTDVLCDLVECLAFMKILSLGLNAHWISGSATPKGLLKVFE